MRVVVAMSGGVDSSVCAAILKENGYEVIGITMQVWPKDSNADEAGRFGGCCSLAAVEDARKVSYRLGIKHYVLNFRDIFKRKVINNFCAEYTRGRTPNPCIKCNQYIKFDALIRRARALDADFIATGHYARIECSKEKKGYLLKKGIDKSKDQSYVLYVMTQEQLKHTLMPLGDFTKEEVRKKAEEFGLHIAQKEESQEICFIPDDDYGLFLSEYIPKAVKQGQIVDTKGNVLGEHKGIVFYTIGQRKGLGIATGEPLYVISIDNDRNRIVVGKEEELYRKELIVDEMNYISIDRLESPIRAKVKIRYKSEEADAEIRPYNTDSSIDSDRVIITFDEPQRAITPGQAAVIYEGDTVVGGGTILSSI